jgi:2-oxoglutarate dehydrogenase E1 component
VFCQDEPQNMGAWSYLAPHLERITGRKPAYAGREAAASPAPGSPMLFALEQEALISTALGVTAKKITKVKH